MKPRTRNYSPVTAIFVAFAFAGATSVHAANTTWVGNTDANFSTLANWNSLTPNGNTPIFGVAGSSGTTLNNDLVGATFAGLTYNAGASAFTIGGNSFTLTGNITNNSTSTQTINNAIAISGARTISAASGQLILAGNLTGTPGTTTLSGNNKITLSGTNNLTMTGNFAGLIINGAGGVDITGATTINGAAGSTFSGYMNVNGNATLTIQSGGSLAINATSNASKPDSGIGNNVAGTSTILVNGGSLTYSGEQGLMIGNNRADATGVLTVSSGTATINAGSTTSTDIRSYVAMGRDNANGVVNLNGGTLETGRRFVRDGGGAGTVGAGTANFNFNGGTLKALANQTSGNGWFETATTGNFQVVTTTVKAGGAKIDTNGFSTNINTNLAHDSGLGATADGGLTKSGTGTLTLGGASTYTGATTISGGTLALGAAGSIDNTSGVSLGTGGTFDVSAKSSYTVNNLSGSGTVTGSLNVSTELAIGNSPGTVSFNGDLTLNSGSTFTYEVVGGGTQADLGDVSGALTLTGSILDLVQLGTYTDGDKFTLFAYDGALTGTFSGLADDTTFVNEDGEWLINYNDTTAGLNGGTSASNTYVTVTAVPEPGAALLGGLGMLALLRRRRVA